MPVCWPPRLMFFSEKKNCRSCKPATLKIVPMSTSPLTVAPLANVLNALMFALVFDDVLGNNALNSAVKPVPPINAPLDEMVYLHAHNNSQAATRPNKYHIHITEPTIIYKKPKPLFY